jgi:hypothetical protein
MEASQPGADGLPVFNLFVRTKRQNVSWPILVFNPPKEVFQSAIVMWWCFFWSDTMWNG